MLVISSIIRFECAQQDVAISKNKLYSTLLDVYERNVFGWMLTD